MIPGPFLRLLPLLIALMALVANGAQNHLRLNPGETIAIMMCGQGTQKTVELTLGGGPAELSIENCCGDCPLPDLAPQPVSEFPQRSRVTVKFAATALPTPISPRSPLWPGAPPHGPPATL